MHVITKAVESVSACAPAARGNSAHGTDPETLSLKQGCSFPACPVPQDMRYAQTLSLKGHLEQKFYKIHPIFATLFPAAKASNHSFFFFIGKNMGRHNTCFDDTWMKTAPKWLKPNQSEPLSVPSAVVPSAQLRSGLFLAFWGPSANCCLWATGLPN